MTDGQTGQSGMVRGVVFPCGVGYGDRLCTPIKFLGLLPLEMVNLCKFYVNLGFLVEGL